MRKPIIWIVIIAIIILAVWFIYSDKNQTPNEPIKVAVLAPLSEFAEVGELVRNGVNDAQSGGIEVIYEDTKCDNQTAISAFRKVTEIDKVQFIMGPTCGSPQEALAPLIKDRDVVVLVSFAAREDLFERGGQKIFQTQYALEDESKFIADKLIELGHERVALISYQNAFSKVHQETFKKHFKGEVVADISFGDVGAANISTELVKVRQANPDAVFIVDASFYFDNGPTKMRELGITTPLFSQYATELPAIREIVEGIFYSYPASIEEDKGAIYGLAKDTAELFFPVILDCDGEFECVHRSLLESDEFNEQGVKKRDIILKKIEDRKPVFVE